MFQWDWSQQLVEVEDGSLHVTTNDLGWRSSIWIDHSYIKLMRYFFIVGLFCRRVASSGITQHCRLSAYAHRWDAVEIVDEELGYTHHCNPVIARFNKSMAHLSMVFMQKTSESRMIGDSSWNLKGAIWDPKTEKWSSSLAYYAPNSDILKIQCIYIYTHQVTPTFLEVCPFIQFDPRCSERQLWHGSRVDSC